MSILFWLIILNSKECCSRSRPNMKCLFACFIIVQYYLLSIFSVWWVSSTSFEFHFICQSYSKITTVVDLTFLNPLELGSHFTNISKCFDKVRNLKEKCSFFPISFEIYKMATELIICWATCLVANWTRTELTWSKCEWTRIWTI